MPKDRGALILNRLDDREQQIIMRSYTHAYANAPVCAVARSTLLTGMYSTTLGTHQMRSYVQLPASTPALATLGTFTCLYAWNSFFWPLVVINTGNTQNHVLTLALNVLRGRASDSPNLILAGAAIAILPPLIVFILGQRFFVESVASSGVKG